MNITVRDWLSYSKEERHWILESIAFQQYKKRTKFDTLGYR